MTLFESEENAAQAWQHRLNEERKDFKWLQKVKAELSTVRLAGHDVKAQGGAIHVVFPETREKIVVGYVGAAPRVRITLYGVSEDPRQVSAPAIATFQADDEIDYQVIGWTECGEWPGCFRKFVGNLRASFTEN